MKILIIYSTTEGQTRKIARFMEDVLQEQDHQVVIADSTDDPPGPDGFDCIFIGGSIHMHKFHASLSYYVRNNSELLNKMPGAFFSVCLAIASGLQEEHKEVDDIATKFLNESGWKPEQVAHIAGALKYTRYNYIKRLVMRMIASKQGESTDTSQDHEYTDWDQVKKFVLDFAEMISSHNIAMHA